MTLSVVALHEHQYWIALASGGTAVQWRWKGPKRESNR